METLTNPDGASITQAVVAEYTLRPPRIPLILPDAPSLCWCEMMRHQFEAAAKDPRLTILDSMHSTSPIPAKAAAALAKHGILPSHRPYDVLMALYQKHGDVGFLPQL